ncbi:membrane protein [Nocardioides sp. YR527]|uniref:YhjD/YihY/BrkB family envelope integrity protein n=1 Tax=Nocardioides sp. YR527 TaxID=1881028 RepID=UPI00088CF088|nr:YhjD/YihY/BrkB family envelope integrity protein [Nocardioides sp. YR527]SDK55838.1 membrane protein [Nocardioides sp. YR527]
MNVADLRDRVDAFIAHVPLLRKLATETIRIEFIDRCMLIAAQALLAMVPMLVVLAAFLPHLTGNALEQVSQVTGVGDEAVRQVSGEVDLDQVRSETGALGLAITIVSATSFGRAVQRMLERVWEQEHVGGLRGARRCLLWVVAWLACLGVVNTVVSLLTDPGDLLRTLLQILGACLVWWGSSWVLLFGRTRGWLLLPGAVLTGVVQVLYSRGSAWLMPAYVESNAEQFGMLGVILALSTWLIGFGGIVVGGALLGRLLVEDPVIAWFVQRVRTFLTRER